MRVFIATDFSVEEFNGRLYYNGAFYKILSRYFEKFGKVVLCTRVIKTDKVPEKEKDATEMIEKVVPLNGLFEAFTGKIKSKMEKEIKNCDLVVSRVPSIIAYRAAECAKKLKKPYFAESMGCAWDAYWNHSAVGKVIAPYMLYKMKQCVRGADYGLYVTEKYLQKKYPCGGRHIHASNVDITVNDSSIMEKRVEGLSERDNSKLILLTAAAVDVRYKGQEFVIKAIPELNKKGICVEYRMAGAGNQEYLRGIAKAAGVEEQVKFLGQLSLPEVLKEMDEVDIYIQPSLQEGLPRSMIEAMSRGCICMGARTAGIPELVDDKFVFTRKSPKAIVKCIENTCKDADFEKEIRRNYEKSKEYDNAVLAERRNAFYESIIADIQK